MLHALHSTGADEAPINGIQARRPGGGGRGGGPFVFDRWESVVGGLEVREALLTRHVLGLEPEAGEPVAADELVAAALGRDEHEAPGGRSVRRRAGTRLGGGKRGGVHTRMIGAGRPPFDGPLSKKQQVGL